LSQQKKETLLLTTSKKNSPHNEHMWLKYKEQPKFKELSVDYHPVINFTAAEGRALEAAAKRIQESIKDNYEY
jgi:hypothetical protein